MNQCTNCGIALNDDDAIIWKCQECGKRYKIKMSKIREMQLVKNRPENAGKYILKCRECGTGMDNGNEELFFKCKECGEVIKGDLEFFASDDMDIEEEYTENEPEEYESHEQVPSSNDDLIVCPECGEKISGTVESCPECGYPIKEERDKLLSKKSVEESVIENPIVERSVIQQKEESPVQEDKPKEQQKEYKVYKQRKNGIGMAIYWIGWIAIILSVLSLFVCFAYNEMEGTIYGITLIISGIVFLGFAEIIFLLDNIRDKLHDMDN